MIEQMGKHPWYIWKSCTTIQKQGLGGTASSVICVMISLLFTQLQCLWCISFLLCLEYTYFIFSFRMPIKVIPHTCPVWSLVHDSSKQVFFQLWFYTQQKGFFSVTGRCLVTLSTTAPFQRHSVDQFLISTGISRPCTLPQSK